MRCLCCGKPLSGKEGEVRSGWHKTCISRFFGTAVLPEIQINESALEALASESIDKGYTVPGVQKKLSLHLLSEGETPRLTLVNYPTGYILKPQVKEFENLPEAEHLVMSMAEAVGIATVPHALIRVEDGLAYITRRVDRIFASDASVKFLAMEDFCQLDLRLTQDKYHGSYERCAKIIDRYSSRVGLDRSELFLRLVFCFLVGNSDMHLKNFSLMETGEGCGEYVLSPAYDLLPVNVIMPEDREQFAMPMNGKKSHLRRNDFLAYAENCGIAGNAAKKMIKSMVAKKDRMIAMCEDSLLSEAQKAVLISLITERADALE